MNRDDYYTHSSIDNNPDACRGWFPAVILIDIINTVQ